MGIDKGNSPKVPLEGSKNIVNLCWHPVTCKLSGKYYYWPKYKGPEVRVNYRKVIHNDNTFSLIANGVENLPAEDIYNPDRKYIVSRQCLMVAGKKRNDLISPGEQTPDMDQKVKYCIGWLTSITS